MQVVIVGVKRTEYKGKDGSKKVGFNYFGTKNFTAYDLSNADCEGQCVVSEFSNVDFNVHPGDEVEFVYEPGFQDRATLVDMRVLSIAEKQPYEDKKDKTAEKASAK